MARNNFIPTSELSKMVFNRFVFLAACLLFAATILAQSLLHTSASETPDDLSVPDGTVFRIKAPKKSIYIGNLTSVNAVDGVGSATISGPKDHKQSPTTSVAGNKDSDSNFFIADTGNSGQLRIGVDKTNQHQFVDQSALLPASLFNLYQKPQISYNAAYTSGNIVKINYGTSRKGMTAVINLVASAGSGTFTAYTCQDPKPVKTSLTATRFQVQTSADMVKVGTDGKICISGNGNLTNLKVTTYGFGKFAAPATVRKLDMRKSGQRTDSQKVVNTGVANGMALVNVTASTVGAGNVSLYTTAKGSNGTTLMQPNGSEAETGFGIVMTDSQGRITLASPKTASYTVDVAAIPLSNLGLSGTMFEQKRSLSTKNGYIGDDLKITKYSGDYINNAEMNIRCEWYMSAIGPANTIYISFNGLDPDKTPDNGNHDGSMVSLILKNIFLTDSSGEQYQYTAAPKVDEKGKASVWFTNGYNELFKAQTWYGSINVSSTHRYSQKIDKAMYSMSVGCQQRK